MTTRSGTQYQKTVVIGSSQKSKSPNEDADQTTNSKVTMRRKSQDYTCDSTAYWLSNGPKISKVGCPCNNDMSNFGGYQHCEQCGSNGGYFSDHE